MNIVLIIPTGIGAEIGGHAGDGNPVAKLMGSVCDNLITHPNVVNASDINEMPENTLYVEGSMLDRFLDGKIELEKVNYNKILVAVNKPVENETINAVSAARATVGADISIVVLEKPLEMIATMETGGATGKVIGWKELVNQVEKYNFDALAITSPITVDKVVAFNYLTKGGINPWGGVEAKASKLIATALNKPVAHAPMGSTLEDFNEVVDIRMSPELVSICYLHCVLKGLHKAPRIGKGLSVREVDFLVTPVGCVGESHRACMEAGIPIIAVEENKTCLNDMIPESFIMVKNYWEAVGLIQAYKAGINPQSVRRPIRFTEVFNPPENQK
jgi:hypothetical protein